MFVRRVQSDEFEVGLSIFMRSMAVVTTSKPAILTNNRKTPPKERSRMAPSGYGFQSDHGNSQIYSQKQTCQEFDLHPNEEWNNRQISPATENEKPHVIIYNNLSHIMKHYPNIIRSTSLVLLETCAA